MSVTQRYFDIADGRLAFGSITGTYATLKSGISGSVRQIIISTSLNNEIILSLDGGTTDFLHMPGSTIPRELILDLDEGQWTGDVKVKHNGVASTSGFIAVGFIRGA